MARDTSEIPAALERRPILQKWQKQYMDAFSTLSSSRNWTSAGPAGIPITEILAYFELNYIYGEDERSEYVKLIQDIDSEYIKKSVKK